MPLRTIAGASFHYKAEAGHYVLAQRGETHEIPEGDDIIRGDKFGAFTSVPGQEPEPPEGSFLPEIQADWSPEEFKRFVDAGTVNEILAGVGEMVEEVQPAVARSLIQAEQSRGVNARGPLLDALQTVAGGVEILDTEPVTEDEGDRTAGSLAEFVETNTVDAVLGKVGDDVEMAEAVRDIEQARGDKARKSLIDALAKIEA